MDGPKTGDRGVGKELSAAGYVTHLWSCNSAFAPTAADTLSG